MFLLKHVKFKQIYFSDLAKAQNYCDIPKWPRQWACLIHLLVSHMSKLFLLIQTWSLIGILMIPIIWLLGTFQPQLYFKLNADIVHLAFSWKAQHDDILTLVSDRPTANMLTGVI